MQENYSNPIDALLRQLVKEEVESYLSKLTFPDGSISIKSFEIFGWRKPREKLKKFYNELLSRGFIGCQYESFEAIFLGNPEPINWLSSTKNLVYIFNRLVYFDIIYKKKNFHLLLAQNFLDKHNQKLNTDSLKTTLCRVISVHSGGDLDDIIKLCN